MNEIPKISITQDFVTDDHDDDMNDDTCTGDINECHTDIENLDSEGDNRFSTSQLLKTRKKVKSKKIEECATDIEDCEGSGSDDGADRSKCNENKISLNEFLDQGFVEETSSFGGKEKIKNSKRMKRASILIPKSDDGAVTDCEDLYSSDNENNEPSLSETNAANQNYDNFLIENDDFSSVDVQNCALKRQNLQRGRNADFSESECELPSNNWNELSDVENIAFSDQEEASNFVGRMKHSGSAFDVEEMTLAVSDTEDTYQYQSTSHFNQQPEIGISFTNHHRSKRSRNKLHARSSKTNNKSNTLTVQKKTDEAVTDVECLDSSDDEGANIRKKLLIPVAFVDSSKPLTDVEDFDVDDFDDFAETSREIKLPSPFREITVLKEDKHGDPVVKVMPLVANSSDPFLSVVDSYVDKGLTDTEDLSGNEADYNNIDKYIMREVPDLDGGVVSSSDRLKTFTRNKNVSNVEPLTDVEEIRMGGTKLRRKKSKPKSSKPKSGPLLFVHATGVVGAITDNEEIYLSDDQLGNYYNAVNRNAGAAALSHEQDGGTDVEEMSGDEEMYKRPNADDIDPNVFRQETFFSTITSSDSLPNELVERNQGYSKISTIIKTREAHDSSADIEATDVEEIVQSDNDEAMLGVDHPSRDNSVTPNELSSTFKECLTFHVYDQSKSEFDISSEAQHIKGYGEIQENHTDVECLDDDKSIISIFI